jgi:hypothetical protein
MKIGDIFSIPGKELYQLLNDLDGFIFGGVCTSLFREKPIEEDQDLDICVPELKDDLDRDILYKYLAMFMKMYGYYEKASSVNTTISYKSTHFGRKVRQVMTFEQIVGSRKVQFVITPSKTPEDFMDGIDLNCCQFWISPVLAGIQSMHNEATLEEIRAGRARINIPEDMTIKTAVKLYHRMRKYGDKRGFVFPRTDVMRVENFKTQICFVKNPDNTHDIRETIAKTLYTPHFGSLTKFLHNVNVKKLIDFVNQEFFVTGEKMSFTFNFRIDLVGLEITTDFVLAAVL